MDGENTLSPDAEQILRCLLVDRHPCQFRAFLQDLGWVVDIKCPIRAIVRLEFEALMKEEETKRRAKK